MVRGIQYPGFYQCLVGIYIAPSLFQNEIYSCPLSRLMQLHFEVASLCSVSTWQRAIGVCNQMVVFHHQHTKPELSDITWEDKQVEVFGEDKGETKSPESSIESASVIKRHLNS